MAGRKGASVWLGEVVGFARDPSDTGDKVLPNRASNFACEVVGVVKGR
jgi:hypothetical protein